MRYSKTTGCFYPEWGKYDDIPSDLISVSDAEFEAAIGRPAGYRIVVIGDRVSIEPDIQSIEERQTTMTARIMAEEDRRSWQPMEHPNGTGVFHKATDTIERMLDRYSDLPESAAFPANGGKWDDAHGNSVPMTMGELKQLWHAFLDRGTHNYGVRKYHIAQMMQSESPEDYDYSGGWK